MSKTGIQYQVQYRVVTDYGGLTGKTIERVIDVGDGIGLVFADKSYAIIRGTYDGVSYLEFETSFSKKEQWLLGIISNEEWQEHEKEMQQRCCQANEQRELAEYERLKAKFKDKE